MVQAKILLFFLVFARVTGVLIFMPVIGGRDLPRMLRVFWSVVLSLLVFPIVWQCSPEESGILLNVLRLISEFLIGLFISVTLMFFFSSLLMAGEVIGRMGGFSLSGLFDPTFREEMSFLSRFLLLLGTVVFILSGGLNVLIRGVLNSFEVLPPGQGCDFSAMMTTLVQMLNTSMTLTFQMAAPVVVTSLVVFLAIGILGRSFPQLNVLSISFSASTLLVFAVLSLSIGVFMLIFEQQIDSGLRSIFQTLPRLIPR